MASKPDAMVWNIGSVKITQIVEVEAGKIIQQIIPDATPKNIASIPWLNPYFVDAAGDLKALVQSFLVETASLRILVDACIGSAKKRLDIPEWGNLQTDFLARLAGHGARPEDIDLVLCTHLHFDHVGWNTHKVDGHWMPTFGRARYLFAETEFNYWKNHPEVEIGDDHAGFDDSVLPIVAAELAELVPANYAISEEISLIPTPGHTPGHVSVLIESSGQAAVISGDVVHHPCQIARPNWLTSSDPDKATALKSRMALLHRCADAKTLFIGSHFATPAAGYLQRDHEGFRLLI